MPGPPVRVAVTSSRAGDRTVSSRPPIRVREQQDRRAGTGVGQGADLLPGRGAGSVVAQRQFDDRREAILSGLQHLGIRG